MHQQNLAIHNGPPRGGRGGNVNGFAPRGGRGGNRGGYTIIDNTDPTEGVVRNNPGFVARNYSNVPPPSTINQDRGRGRGRGRGGRGGGRGRGGEAAV
jgi:5'-3' exoribonuclease 1